MRTSHPSGRGHPWRSRAAATVLARAARDPLLRLVRETAGDCGARLHLVGGYVRDALLNRRVRDVDFVLEGPPRPFLDAIARRLGRRVVTFRKRGIANRRVTAGGRDLDFVELGDRTLAAELRRRDFTINAIAVDLEGGTLRDPAGGLDDLRRRRIRATSRRVLLDDPARLLRAVRLAAENPRLAIDRRTRAWIAAASRSVRPAAAERVREELDRILAGARASWGVRTLDDLGLLRPLIPEVEALRGLAQNRYHHLDAWRHTLAAIEAADAPGRLARGVVVGPAPGARVAIGARLAIGPRDLADLRWALLLHDLGKAATRERGPDGDFRFHNHQVVSERLAAAILARLRFSRARAGRIRRLVREHLRISIAPEGGLSPRAMRRIVRDLGADTPLLVLHSLADKAASRGRGHARTLRRLREACRDLLALYREQAAALLAPPRLVDGRDVIAATGLPPGPRIGELLREIRDLQVDGALATREAALDYLRERGPAGG